MERVKAGIVTKFTAGPDPRYNSQYLTPQEKLEEFKKENPDIGGTVHNKTDRQLYIGNLPPEIRISELCKHLNDALFALNLCEKEEKPIVDAWISGDGHYAFVEFRTIKDAHLGFHLTQISIHGHALKVGKPRIANSSYHLIQQQMAQMQDNRYEDVVKVNHMPTGGYVNPQAMVQNTAAINNQFDTILKNLPGPPPTVGQITGQMGGQMPGMPGQMPGMPGQMPGQVPMANPSSFKSKVITLTKLKVINWPIEYTENEIRQILEVCGEIKELELIKDENTGKYKGEIYVQYNNEEDSRKAETTLMGMKIQDAYLHIKKVQTTTTLQNDGTEGPKIWQEECNPCSCLTLTNLLIPESITDPLEYAEVEDEVFEEMEQHGKVLQVVAPRPSPNFRPGQQLEAGVGKVFIKFEQEKDATVAKASMRGRRFEGRVVEAKYYPEEQFSKGIYNYYG